MRTEEFTIGFGSIGRLMTAPAWLSQRERLALYSQTYCLAPRYALELGRARGGSTLIMSGALDDVGLGGKILSLDPEPQQTIPETAAMMRHNTTLGAGFFPQHMPAMFDGRPTDGLFEFCFYDANHTRVGIREHLQVLKRYMAPGSFIMCHDGYNHEQGIGMSEGCKAGGLIDCGMQTRCANDTSAPGEVYGGMRLFKVPGELPPNSGKVAALMVAE